MKMPQYGRKWSWFALLAAVGASSAASGQGTRRVVEEPQLFKLQFNDAKTGVYSEGTFEQTSFGEGAGTITHNRLFVGPSVELGAVGSIYHPYLFHYEFRNEGAYGYTIDELSGPGTHQTRNEWEYLGRFSGTADILPYKPLNGNLFGNYEHGYRDYDFFSRVTVDTWRYGSRVGYSEGPFSLLANYSHRDEDVTGLASPSISHQDLGSLTARYTRPMGDSTLNYTLTQDSREDFGNNTSVTDQTVSFSDGERFGSHGQYRLNSHAGYTHRNGIGENSDQINSGVLLDAEHRDDLKSNTELTYDRYQNQPFQSDTVIGRTELRHQLYESLTSRLIGQGSNMEVKDATASGYTRRIGGGFAESYTKRLGEEHRLSLENSVLLEHTDQSSVGTVENERHTFGELGAGSEGIILRQTKIRESTIVVFDANRFQQWVNGLDYEITLNGQQTIITRRPGTTRIPAGATVLVDYQAEPAPPGNYESLTDYFQIRLDLWKNLWGIYTRVNFFLNNAPSDLRVQTVRSYTFGTDLNWKWFRAGGEYQIYDADMAQYTSARLFQSAGFKPDESSSLSFSLTESFIDYKDAGRQEQDYRFISYYRHMLTPHLSVDLEGGVDFRRGRGVDQTLATFRPGLDYRYGNLTVRAGYDFEYSLFLNSEERTKHYFYLRAQRSF